MIKSNRVKHNNSFLQNLTIWVKKWWMGEGKVQRHKTHTRIASYVSKKLCNFIFWYHASELFKQFFFPYTFIATDIPSSRPSLDTQTRDRQANLRSSLKIWNVDTTVYTARPNFLKNVFGRCTLIYFVCLTAFFFLLHVFCWCCCSCCVGD